MAKYKENLGKIIILSAYAGGGKDYFGQRLMEKISNSSQIAFADKIKSIIGEHIPIRITEQFPNLSKVELVDYLKNEAIHINVYQDLNMRGFLQKLLGDCIRSVHKDIHCAYFMNDYLHKVREGFENFVCTDNRYENEQDYLININSLDTLGERVDFCKTQILAISNDISIDQINKVFKHHFPQDKMSNDDFNFLKNVQFDFIQSVKTLQKTPKPKSETQKPFILRESLLQNTDSNLLLSRLGAFRVLRKAVNDDFDIENSDRAQLIREIQKVSNIEKMEAVKLIDRYNEWEIPLSDLKKYGICRTNPTVPSESELVNKGRVGITIENIGSEGSSYIARQIEKILSIVYSDNTISAQNQNKKKRDNTVKPN